MTLAPARTESSHFPLSRVHGLSNVVGGLWPVVHLRSFEAVLGPKEETWLLFTVAGLLVGNGMVQLRARGTEAGWRAGRDVGVATATVLLAIDLAYAPRGKISRGYLADAVIEAGWLVAWACETKRHASRSGELRST